MSEFDIAPETGHAAIVALAVVALAVVLVVTATYAHDALQMVAYSAVYVLGVTSFWLLYWVLSRRSANRRAELLELESED